MDESARFFEKANIIFNLLKDGNAVSINTIKAALSVSVVTVTKALNEFNQFDNTILFLGNGYVKFSEKKKSLIECRTYKIYYWLITLMLENPEHYLYGNEIEISTELGIDRKILQKIKALVKLKIHALQKKEIPE
ncbi:MAG: hypothetical protein IK107_05095 [Oscillospiraceae bacterium]|nr:hypothetical protein [Oscillospiraceae bacterium]